MINEIEKYVNKYTFLRYTLLIYLISLAGQLILLRDKGLLFDNYKSYNLLYILNFTKEVSIFLLVIGVFIFIDILLKFRILICSIIAKLGALIGISLLLFKFGLLRIFFSLDIRYCIQNFDVVILLFITMFILEGLSYTGTKDYKEFDFLCRMIVYSFMILKGISLFMN